MAYVYMKGSRSSVSLLVNYVLNPEKTTEMTDTERLELHQERAGERRSDVSALRSEKRKYVTCLNCTEENAIRQFQETKFIWSQITGRDKSAGKVCMHVFQSFKEGEVSAETAHEIGVKLAERLWGCRFEVIVATHCNTEHYQMVYLTGK